MASTDRQASPAAHVPTHPEGPEPPAAPDFVHLRVHSHYSLLSSPCRVKELVQAAKEDGQRALALTDTGNLFGAVEFYKSCKTAGIKPILGMSGYCAAGSRLTPSGADNQTYQLTLLAADQEGWQNLKTLTSLGYIEGFHYRPRFDRELLQRYGRGLVVLSGNQAGEVAQHLVADRYEAARRAAGELAEIVGTGNFWLEQIETGLEAGRRVNEGLRRLAAELGLPIVATNDVHYLRPEDWIVQDIQLCIRNGHVVSDPNRFRMSSRELYLKTRAQMAAAFAAQPEALRATVTIAERCNVQLDFGTYHVPVFDSSCDETPDQLFERLCREGARRRYAPADGGELPAAVCERLEYEMAVIRKLGFVSYFLVVADFIAKAREMGIPVGPGRGSAAGSLVAYALAITDVDPLRYNLIFERFLNAERVSMPDIDIDFCGERRDQIIDYVRRRYGAENVCQIITFGTMASRGVLRDVGRVLEIPLADIDKIAKKVPQGPGASLKKALESDPELQAIRDASAENRRLFDLGVKLEGLARHSSIHAAGVVIADRPLLEYAPLCKNGDDVITQWQMNELEEVGLLKMDFLGLKTLTILQESVRLIEKTSGVRLDLDALPLDDAATYQLMTRGDTLGVFQLESDGMRELLGRLKPDTFEDVIAVLALYRPGPLGSGMVDMFVRRKHGQERVEYPHASLQSILEESYGVIVYQEQVMRIANVYAGFSMNEADALRKAMGKKKPEVMAKFKDQFVAGAAKLGHDQKTARELFETMEYFAGYGFNKSHSTAYALLTFRTAYLKAHHPVEFLAANLTIESGNSDKVKEFVDESRRMGVQVLPPDVTRSVRVFDVEEGAIRYGLGAIKGLGTRAADLIGEVRASTGSFHDLDDFCERVDASVLNKGAMEALAKAGAFDTLGTTRRAAFESIDTAMRAAALTREDRKRGQGLLFQGPATSAAAAAPAAEPAGGASGRNGTEWTEMERLAREKEALGFYLSGHPFEKRGRFLAQLAGHTSQSVAGLAAGTEVRVAGMISVVRVMQIKNGKNAGQKMARFQLEDLHGVVKVTCFAAAYQRVKHLLVEDAIVFVRGRVDGAGDDVALLLDELQPAQQVVNGEVGALVLRLQAGVMQERNLERILQAATDHRGSKRLEMEIVEEERITRLRADSRYSVALNDDLLDDLAEIVGPGNLSFRRN